MWSSGFHRITGLMLNGSKLELNLNKEKLFSFYEFFNSVLYTAGPLAFLATGHSAEILQYIYTMNIPSWFIFSVKLFMAWP